MKITFICPKLSSVGARDFHAVPEEIKALFERNPVINKNLELMKRAFSGLGLLTVAASVPQDIEVEFFDENMEDIDFGRDFDLVAISGNLDQLHSGLKLCDIFRKKGVPVIAGGTAVISFPDLYARKGATVFIGEGEELLQIYLQDLDKQQVKKIYDSSVGNAHPELEHSPIPRFDLAAKYSYSMIGVQVTRGCPYNCSFCQESKIFGRKLRLKPVENVIEEIKQVKQYWPDSLFFFYDDNPFVKKDYTHELFEKLYQRDNIDLGNWGSSADVTLSQDTELMDLITSKGPLSYLGVGFESLSSHVLESINNTMKKNNADGYKEAIERFRAHHINPVGYFIVGFENNTEDDLKEIVQFVRETKIAAEIGRLTPLPGTQVYAQLKQDYEAAHGKMRSSMSSLAEWGRLNKFLKEKSLIDDTLIEKYLTELFKIVYSDNDYLSDYMDKGIPYCIHF